MILEIIPHHTYTGIVIFREVKFGDAWKLYDLLNKAFPYDPLMRFNFFICCAGGYENAIQFQN